MKTIQLLKENYLLIGILVLGAFLRFYKLDFQSIWLDEVHTMNEANPKVAFSDLYGVIMSGEQMPPLYFYTLYFLFKIFGYTAFIARLYSAIIGVVGIYSIYLFGKEIFNKRVGIIASALISVNYFQLYYSQEARPYVFLFLFTTLSFCYLIRYIKVPTIKNALFYGAIAALMLYFHFFGLFVLLSQCFTLLLFLILSEEKKKFFLNSLAAGILILILFIPAIKIFIKVTEIKEFWIPAPTLDVYTLVFKEFFGNSELLLTLMGFLFVLYLIRLAKEKDTPITYNSIIKNKTIFSFVILIPWIVIVILIPLIRSYLSIPMIISRYFITVLPAIIILIAIAINQFNNKIIKVGFISIFVIFSVTDIIVVKKYYRVVNKTQFREATQFIIDNNKNKEPVVTSLGWYFPYFLKNDKVNMTIIDKSLEIYVNEMMLDSTKKKAFWYVDAHLRPYKLSEPAQKFIDDNFIIDNNIDLYDAWAKHFIITSSSPIRVDISKYNPLLDRNGDLINFSIENFTTNPNKIILSGWAYFPDKAATQSKIDIVLIDNGKATKLPTQKVKRDDVTSYFKSNVDISNSGFSSKIDLTKIQKGNYRIGILINNKELGKEGLVLTDKTFSK